MWYSWLVVLNLLCVLVRAQSYIMYKASSKYHDDHLNHPDDRPWIFFYVIRSIQEEWKKTAQQETWTGAAVVVVVHRLTTAAGSRRRKGGIAVDAKLCCACLLFYDAFLGLSRSVGRVLEVEMKQGCKEAVGDNRYKNTYSSKYY